MNLDIIIILIVAGIIQGILEWLPVSSEAFVFLFFIFCGLSPGFALILAMAYHLPTGIAAILFYRKEYNRIVRDFLAMKLSSITMYVILATISTAIVAIPLYFVINSILAQVESIIEFAMNIILAMIGIAMVVTGIMVGRGIVYGDRKLSDVRVKDCFFIGAVQGLSILPGVSRSGVTIAALIYRRYDEESCLNGSFILCGVASLGIFLFLAILGELSFDFITSYVVVVSMFVAFIVSMVSMKALLTIARRMKYGSFLKFMGSIMLISSLILIAI